MGSRFARALAVVVVASLTAGAAPLDPAVRSCIDGYNERVRQVSLQSGLSIRACLRGVVSGRQDGFETCVAGDRNGAVAARQARVAELFAAGVCGGDEPLQRGAAAGSLAHRQAAVDLAHDLFADPLDPLGGGAADRACLDAGIGHAVVGMSALVGAHRRCVTRGLRQGDIADEQTLTDACGTRAQVEDRSRTAAVLARAAAATRAACAGRETTALFPGLAPSCHTGHAALAACIEHAAACRACLAVEASNWTPIPDGSPRCDEFDDGVLNQSCGEFPFPPGARCRLATDSRLRLASIGLPLNLQIQGAVRIDCAAADADGRAACRCDLDERPAGVGGATLVIPAIGDVCINPHPGCAAGVVDCDGGSTVDVDLSVDHNIGGCAGHADCAQACAADCAARGAGYVVAAAACEGRCLGGADDGVACTADSQCALGHCVGSEPVAHPGVCNCTCQGTALGPPVGPGALGCRLGMQIDVEWPSDGACRGPVQFSHPPFCAALTTGSADALITDANNQTGVTIRQFTTGVPHGSAIACADLAAGRTAGLALVGSAAALDTTLGDFLTTLSVVCE